MIDTGARLDDGTTPHRDILTRVCAIAAVILAAAALAVSLLHAGPTGATGATGPSGSPGLTGATGPAGPAAYDPYSYICTMSNVPFYYLPGSPVETAYLPCSNTNPNG
jgi:hypothetical protein